MKDDLLNGWAGPRWKGNIWLVPLAVQYEPLIKMDHWKNLFRLFAIFCTTLTIFFCIFFSLYARRTIAVKSSQKLSKKRKWIFSFERVFTENGSRRPINFTAYWTDWKDPLLIARKHCENKYSNTLHHIFSCTFNKTVIFLFLLIKLQQIFRFLIKPPQACWSAGKRLP